MSIVSIVLLVFMGYIALYILVDRICCSFEKCSCYKYYSGPSFSEFIKNMSLKDSNLDIKDASKMFDGGQK